MHDRLLGSWFPAIAWALAAAVLVLGSFTLAVIVPDLQRSLAAPSPSPTPAPTEATVPMMRIPVPAGADCAGCHAVSDGTIGTRPIPRLGHPVEGWTTCVACHAEDSLVAVAPGHTGIHADACLLCHQPAEHGASAPPRPHHVVGGEACITCHGVDASLPPEMVGRDDCWLCHVGPDVDDLFGRTPVPVPPPPPSAAPPS